MAYFVIERYGRRKVMMVSSAACATCWTVIALVLGLSENGLGDSYKLGIVAVSFFFVFFASFAMGALSVPWLYPTEVNALAFRAKGASLAMATNWICNYMVAQITPPGIANLGYRVSSHLSPPTFSFSTPSPLHPLTSLTPLPPRSIIMSVRRALANSSSLCSSGLSGPSSAPPSSRLPTSSTPRPRTAPSKTSTASSPTTAASLCTGTRSRRSSSVLRYTPRRTTRSLTRPRPSTCREPARRSLDRSFHTDRRLDTRAYYCTQKCNRA